MKLRPAPAALALAACLTAGAAAGQTLAQPGPLPAGAAAQAEALAREAVRALAPAGARISAQAGPADPRWRLAPCQRVQAHLPVGALPLGRLRVGLRCMSGAAWNVYLPVTVRVLAPAWVADQTLPAGTLVAPELLRRAEVDWAGSPEPPLDNLALLQGRVLARGLAGGQALRAADLQPRRWFSSGQRVEVVARGAGFAVVAEAEALGDGFEGREVRVRTSAGQVLKGRPVAERRLELLL